MSTNAQTNWVLGLVEKITGPMKSVMKSTTQTEDAVDKLSASYDKLSDTGKKTATKLIKDHKELAEFIAHTERRIQQNTDALKAWDNTHPMRKKLELDVEESIKDLKEYKQWLTEIEREMGEVGKEQTTSKLKRNWGDVALAANQAWEVTQKVFDSMRGVADIRDLETSIQRMTDITGNALSAITAKTNNLAKVYREDANSIALAANSTSKQMGISYDAALSLIEKGFQRGANLNHDMLDQLREYGPQMKAAGIDASQGLAIMAKAAKEGVFSDKALDAIKEANLSLREMGQPQVDALKAVGIEVKELAGKTSFEAVQMIAKAMDGATVQAKQKVIADIFRGAGEDAGLSFIMGLGGAIPSLDSLPAVQEAGAGLKGWFADLESTVASGFGNIAVWGQQFGGVAQIVSAAIPVIQTLTKATWFQNAATKAMAVTQGVFNAVLNMSPLGWIATAIGAVTLAVKYCWDNFESFRGFLFSFWETFKTIFNNVKGLFLAVFAPIGDAISAVQEGRWGDAAQAVLQLNPISTAKRTYDYIADGGLTKGVSKAAASGYLKGVQSFRDDNKPKVEPPAVPGTPAGAMPVLDGKIAPAPGGGGSSKKSSLGLDIVGGGGFGSSSSSSGSSTSLGSITGTGGAISGKTVHVTQHNHFNLPSIASNMDVRKVAEQILQYINQGFKDAEVSVG